MKMRSGYLDALDEKLSMKRELRNLCFLIIISNSMSVIMGPKDRDTFKDQGQTMNIDDSFGTCLAGKEYNTFQCINRGALTTLQSLNDKDLLDFGSIRLEKAENQAREILDLDYDPKNLANVVKAATRLMENRNLKWNLDNVYPGLQMRVGPAIDARGVLEFVLNERTGGGLHDRQDGMGRQLARHLLLPFLLGFKFNLASLIPVMFGVLLLITKKALFLTKIGLLINGLLGWNMLFSNKPTSHYSEASDGYYGYGYGHGHEIPLTNFPSHHGQYYFNRPYLRSEHNVAFPQSQHVIREVVNVYDGDDENKQNPRNEKKFVWSKQN